MDGHPEVEKVRCWELEVRGLGRILGLVGQMLWLLQWLFLGRACDGIAYRRAFGFARRRPEGGRRLIDSPMLSETAISFILSLAHQQTPIII